MRRAVIAATAAAAGALAAGAAALAAPVWRPPAGAPAEVAAETNPPGDIPDNQAFVVEAPRGAGFTVKVPEGWARSSASAGESFTDKLNEVGLHWARAKGPLTAREARASVVPALRRAVRRFRLTGISTVTRAAGPALLVAYRGAGPKDPVTGKSPLDAVERYDFFHRGRRVTVTLSGPVGADNVDPWRIVTDSVRWAR